MKQSLPFIIFLVLFSSSVFAQELNTKENVVIAIAILLVIAAIVFLATLDRRRHLSDRKPILSEQPQRQTVVDQRIVQHIPIKDDNIPAKKDEIESESEEFSIDPKLILRSLPKSIKTIDSISRLSGEVKIKIEESIARIDSKIRTSYYSNESKRSQGYEEISKMRSDMLTVSSNTNASMSLLTDLAPQLENLLTGEMKTGVYASRMDICHSAADLLKTVYEYTHNSYEIIGANLEYDAQLRSVIRFFEDMMNLLEKLR